MVTVKYPESSSHRKLTQAIGLNPPQLLRIPPLKMRLVAVWI